MKRIILSLTLMGVLLFGSDVAFDQLAWPVAKLRAAVTFITSGQIGYAADDTTETSAAIDTSGADFYVISQATNGTAPNAPTDDDGNTYTARTLNNPDNALRIWYVANVNGHSGFHYTISSGSGNVFGSVFMAFAGVKTSSPFDQESATGSASTSSTCSAASITPTENNELIIAAIGDKNTARTHSIDSSMTIPTYGEYTYVQLGFNAGVSDAYFVQGTAGAFDPTWTLSGSTQWLACSVASFKMNAVTSNHNGLLLRGVGN